MKTLTFHLAMFLFAAVLWSPMTWAQGVLRLYPPGTESDVPPPVRPQFLGVREARLLKHRVRVEIDGTVARTFVDQTFFNPTAMRLEGTYLFAFPTDAAISDFAMYIDGKRVAAELLEKEKAHKIYTDIVRKLKDPALLEYVGRNLVKIRIFPVEPRSEKRIELRYTQLLPKDGNLFTYEYPMQTSQSVGEMVIDGHVRSDSAVNTVYSPTFPLDISRSGEREFRFSFEETDFQPEANLALYYSVTDDDVGVSLLTFRRDGGEGYFMLLVAPNPALSDEEVLPKDVTFVIDTSGSMSGEKIQQVKNALRFCVENLRGEDRFNLLPFSTEVHPLFDGPVSVNSDNRRTAVEFIDRLQARGGTNISDALAAALNGVDSEGRPHLILFLTDGLPTVGVTDIDQILGQVQSTNSREIRIFAFGVGHDVNTHLLDQLSGGTRAVSTYVHPSEDIEVKISSLFSKVSRPVLTDLHLTIEGVGTSDIYPRNLPDLFDGGRLVLLGRYDGSGDARIHLDGHVLSQERHFEYELAYAERSDDADFLPHLWATRKVGYLMDEIRLHGENPELKEEIIRLGRQFGIVTPYTSFLVVEETPPAEGRPRPIPLPMGSRSGMMGEPVDAAFFLKRANKPDRRGLSAAVGRQAVRLSQEVAMYKDKEEVFSRDDAAGIRRIGDRAFRLSSGKWIQSTYKPGVRTVKIKYASQDYFDMLAKHLKLGETFALGKKVIFQWEGKWYEITAD